MNNTEVVFVSGQRGSGKTQWVKHYLGGLSRVLIYDTLGEYADIGAPVFRDPRELIAYCQKKEGSEFLEAIYSPLDDNVEMFCRIALAVCRVHVVLEELDAYSSPYSTPPHLLRLIRYGRHAEISIVGISRRPAEVSRHFTSQANRFVIFRQIEPKDIGYWRGIIGKPADKIPELEQYHHIDIDFDDPPTLENPFQKPLEIAPAKDNS